MPETPTTAKPARVREVVPTADGDAVLQVTGSGFWQVHPAAPALLSSVVKELARHRAT